MINKRKLLTEDKTVKYYNAKLNVDYYLPIDIPMIARWLNQSPYFSIDAFDVDGEHKWTIYGEDVTTKSFYVAQDKNKISITEMGTGKTNSFDNMEDIFYFFDEFVY